MSTVNVNLDGSCTCATGRESGGARHFETCKAAPVLIPCPVPRSVTFEVVLGECLKACSPRGLAPGHLYGCPGRPVRVACSIAGTWEESEAVAFDEGGATFTDAQLEAAEDACRERWALVKALVLGKSWGECPPELQTMMEGRARVGALFTQRDAVYAALADMARAENLEREALAKAVVAVPGSKDWSETYVTFPMNMHDVRSGAWLSRYVKHLIEQVGSLT